MNEENKDYLNDRSTFVTFIGNGETLTTENPPNSIPFCFSNNQVDPADTSTESYEIFEPFNAEFHVELAELSELLQREHQRYLNDETLKQFDDEICRVLVNSIPEHIAFDVQTRVTTYYYSKHVMRYVEALQENRRIYLEHNYKLIP